MLSFQVITIAYQTPRWLRVLVRSFQRYFPRDQILVVDNNPPEQSAERDWCTQQTNVLCVLPSGHPGQPGPAMDLALAWCREHQREIMIYVEPDCEIRGTLWLVRLVQAIEEGADMAGCFQSPWGAIHVCPTAWRTSVAWPSFVVTRKRRDVAHPRYNQLFRWDKLEETLQQQQAPARRYVFYASIWDVGQRAWFSAAVRDATRCVDAAATFKHYGGGSKRNQNHPALDGPLLHYLET
jgi:hypothetical protein